MARSLRTEMPHTAAWIDALRGAWGSPAIDSAIKAGIDGQPTFCAAENGQEIGTRCPSPGASFTADQCLASNLPESTP